MSYQIIYLWISLADLGGGDPLFQTQAYNVYNLYHFEGKRMINLT